MADKIYLDRAALLAASDRPTEEVWVPEWGSHVRIRTITAGDRDAFDAGTYQVRGKDVQVNRVNLRARLVALCAVDAAGERLFTDEDVAALAAKGARAIDRLFEAAQRLNGLTQKDIEDLAGNSEPGPSGASSSS
ncbi:MAG TPA: hypothetical protein VGV13_13810 [Methylomirabilota bacterium]|jgi:hypothetical protein|nr:hypothetical protein [Methylomirabilota bacterium]